MTRDEHNAKWQARRKPSDIVYCHMIRGYGELSQYDPRCPACWLGTTHTWERHDQHLKSLDQKEDCGL